MPSSYPLSTEMARFVAQTCSFAVESPETSAQRAAYSRMCQAFTPARPTGLEVEDFTLSNVPVRLYRPNGLSSDYCAPCVIYLHGGGWVVGDLDSHDFLTASLAVDLNAVVIAVDYRLAPEVAFPAAFDDCLAVWRGVQHQARWLCVDSQRVVIAGDSAGGNLTAAVCLALRDAGEGQPVGQALIYPALGGADDLPSRSECHDAPLLTREDIHVYQRLYLPDPEDAVSPYAMPLTARHFRGLAPAFIAVAQFDPLRDDGHEYERVLSEAGVATQLHLGHGLIHGYLRAKGRVPEVDCLYARMVQALLGFFAGKPPDAL
ncbi:alpha/beta hydrolase [Pseudomonas huanghezhanensis]|uniref:alpha/beta hydrolase n=1 Tax=Pseudomonas huanghezhanensis TaxID=3002903 RepID=UPI002286657C|nr:alpha/beta hydrolase [Pseudomonas sp. BSw22131]